MNQADIKEAELCFCNQKVNLKQKILRKEHFKILSAMNHNEDP